MRTLRYISLLIMLATCIPGAWSDVYTEHLQPAFEEHCIRCHGEKDKVKGKVNLLELSSETDLLAKPELLEELVAAVEFAEMPPEDEPQPSEPERAALLSQLEQLLTQAAESNVARPRTPIRRMNRFQYNNAVRDLFDLKVTVFQLPERMLRVHGNYFQPASGKMPEKLKAGNRPLGKSQLIEPRLDGVAPFPQDLRAEHGFDNQADHLSLSPLLMESFLTLGQSIVNSRDFSTKTCGIWNDFFVPPPPDTDLEAITRERLKDFLTRAFRRPVDAVTLDRYAGYVATQLNDSANYTEAMQSVAAATIASPRFIYFYEHAGKTDAPEPLDDYEIASRLALFLWSSIPDTELLALAQAGKLRDPTIRQQQVDRMLTDPKIKGFCDAFPGQWLQLDRLISTHPDKKAYPQFYFAKFRASMHMMLEPLLLFETTLIENRSILEFIDSDYSYRSGLLNNHYQGLKGGGPPTAIEFVRTPLNDRRQGGVITTLATMSMTSGPNRTQPITRGAWMAGVIFNDPPKPPPANVPELPEDDHEAIATMTLRERLDAHRDRPDCAGCHAQIDPLGFALENYGVIGGWRDKYENGREVDMAGVLFRKHRFENLIEFKDAILAEKERFAHGFAKHVLAYALGREVAPADTLAMDQISQQTIQDEYRLKPLIHHVINSEPFLTKYHPPEGNK